MKKIIFLISMICFITTKQFVHAQTAASDSSKFYLSLETDPAFWAGTLPNGAGIDANIDFRFKKHPKLRLGLLGYSGKWSGAFGKDLLLTGDFKENDWQTQWNGLGVEVQYQYRLGLARGGLQTGTRLQWNQFKYKENGIKKGEANHGVITPQIGFQWFPFKTCGLYLLPWAGIQLPVLGTDRILINDVSRETRRSLLVLTAHIGWEFGVR